MAEITKGILGGFSGKVGTIVGSYWRGKNIIRSLPAKGKREASDLQRKQRDKFALMAKFLAPIREVTSKYYGKRQGVKSRTNLAMSKNLLDAVLEENGELFINFAQVQLTKGHLAAATVTAATRQDQTITYTLAPQLGKNEKEDSDRLQLILFSKEHQLIHFATGPLRSETADGEQQVALPENWQAKLGSVAVWAFYTNAKGNLVSNSMFIGMF